MKDISSTWNELDIQFRKLASTFFEANIIVAEEIIWNNPDLNEFDKRNLLNSIEKNERNVSFCGNTKLFIENWKKYISIPNSLLKFNGEEFPSNNYLELASELGVYSHQFDSQKALIDYATNWTRAYIDNVDFLAESIDIDEYDKRLDDVLRMTQYLVIDHAFYALYIAWKSDSILLVRENNKELLKAISHDEGVLNIVSDRRFEEIVAFLFECAGCSKVKLTQFTRDYGADILAWHGGPLNSEILTAIQVKKYSTRHNVGLKDIYELHGAVSHYSADLGQLVTTTNFTGPAKQFAKEQNYNLVNLQMLQDEIKALLK